MPTTLDPRSKLVLDKRSSLEKLLNEILRPVSCGRHADIPAYLRWKIYHCQLWRFEKRTEVPVIPYTPVVLGDHSEPPRVRDTVLVGDSIAHITRIDRRHNEVHVWFHLENKPGSYDLDSLETNRGKIRWIVH